MHLLKSNNTFMVLAMVASFSVLAACGPQKKGAKFADRGTATGAGTPSAEKAAASKFKRPEANSEAAKVLKAKVAKLSLEVLEAKNEDGEIFIDEEMSRLNDGKSVEIPAEVIAANDNEKRGQTTQKLAPDHKIASRYRLFKVDLTFLGLGQVTYARATSGVDVVYALPVEEDCRENLESKIKLKVVCIDEACDQVSIEVVDWANKEEDARARFFLKRAKADSKVNVQAYSYEIVDNTAELMKKGIEVKTQISKCSSKDIAALAATPAGLISNPSNQSELVDSSSSDSSGSRVDQRDEGDEEIMKLFSEELSE